MQRADLTTRAVAGFVDLLIILALVRLPDVIGLLAGAGYLLARDGLFERQSVGKRLVGLRVVSCDPPAAPVSYRESIIRNTTLAAALLLFSIPWAGWVLGPLALAIEGLVALGDERGMRVGDIVARTLVVAEPAVRPDGPAQTPDGQTGGGPAEGPGGASQDNA